MYAIAERQHVDIDVVRSWPLSKVAGWIAFFEMQQEAIAQATKPPEKHTGYRFVRRGDVFVRG